jgi:hypothetical protein
MPEVNMSVPVATGYRNHIVNTHHLLRREWTSDVEFYPAIETSGVGPRGRSTNDGVAPVLADLSIMEVANDPLIAMLNRADGVNERSFAQLLESASRVLGAKPPLIHVDQVVRACDRKTRRSP